MAPRRDITGQTFGRLTALRISGKRRQAYIWRCMCSCGNETDVPVSALTSGNTSSCGCLRVERLRAALKKRRGIPAYNRSPIKGNVYGALTVLEHVTTYRTKGGYARAQWKCRCECGNEVVVGASNLKSGDTASCGCKQGSSSKGENALLEFVQTLDPNAYGNRELPRADRYRFDVISERHKVVVEFNGVFWHSAAKVDKLYHLDKRLAAEAAGYRMLTIWQDEWAHNRAGFEALLRRVFKAQKLITIGARKLEIVTLTAHAAQKYHQRWHVQKAPFFASLNFGLRDGDFLVAVASFRRTGKTLELTRYTVRGGCSVPGGLRRLMAQCPDDIETFVTYTDRDHFDGKIYRACGFTYESTSLQLRYLKGSVRVSRQTYMKHKLADHGITVEAGETERAALERHGIYQCWNSGVDRYVFHQTSLSDAGITHLVSASDARVRATSATCLSRSEGSTFQPIVTKPATAEVPEGSL